MKRIPKSSAHAAAMREATAKDPRGNEAPASLGALTLEEIVPGIDGFVFLLEEDGRIADFRSGAAGETYVPPEDFLGRSLSEILPPDAAATVSGAMRAASPGAPVKVAYSLPFPDGPRDYEARMVALTGGRCLAIVSQVKPAERVEAALRAHEEKLRQAVRISQIGIFEHDHRTDTIYWSPEQRANYGWGPDEVVTLPAFLSNVHPDDRERIAVAVQRAHDPRGDGLFDVEHRITRRDGAVRWLSTRSRTLFDGEGDERHPVRTVGGVVDITEQREIELRLRESEARLNAFFLQSPVAMAISDMEGRYTHINPTLAALNRKTPEEHLGKRPSELFPAEMAGPIEALTNHVRATGEPEINREMTLRTPDRPGELRHVLYSSFPITNAEGEVRGVGRVLMETTDLKRAEAALRIKDQAIEASINAIALADPQGTLTYANPAFERLWGYTLSEIIGRPPTDFAEPASVNAILAALKRDGSVQGELVARRKDGSTFDIVLAASVVHDSAGNVSGLMGSLLDITERKRVEAQLRASEAGLREAQGIARMGNWDLSLLTGELRWSDEIFRIFEIDRERFGASYDAFLDLIHPDDRDRVNRAYTESVANRTSYLVVHRLLMPDGRVKVIQERGRTFYADDGTPLRSAGTVQDITALHEAEAALRASEERFRSLIEQGIDLVMTIGLDGRLEFASPSLLGTTGYQPGEVAGMHFSELVHPEDLPHIASLVTAMMTGARSTARATFRAKVKTGGWRTLDGVGRDLRHVPAVHGIVVNLRDVTEQRALEERLLQTEKLESIGRLAGGIAHDFNNVLTAILGYTEMMQQDARAGQPMHTGDLGEIQAAAERARGLTTQLLTFARKQAISPRPTDLNAVVHSTRKLLASMLREDIELRASLDPALWRVLVDPSQIGQVVLNLAVNARDAMPAGGRISFETRNVNVEGAAGGGPDLAPGDYVVLSVSDSGTGIAAADLPHIFEPFYTTKPDGKGTGLGLSTVYGIAKQSAGHVSVSSEPGFGTTFCVYLPRALDGAEAADDERSSGVRLGAEHETVLVVEDDPAVRGLSVRALRDAGYSVLEAGAPDEAMRLSRNTPGPIHLLVTDVIMPGMNGARLARVLLLDRPATRVLYVSGYAQDTVELSRGISGARDLLDKPFTPSELRERVRSILDAEPAPVT